MEFGPFGLSEMLFIALLALVVFGPRRLPELGHALGRWTVKLRRATADLRRAWETEVDAETVESVRDAARQVQQVRNDIGLAGREAWREGAQAADVVRRTADDAGRATAEAARAATAPVLPRSTPGPAPGATPGPAPAADAASTAPGKPVAPGTSDGF